MGFQVTRMKDGGFVGKQEVLAEINRLEAMAERLRAMVGPTEIERNSGVTSKALGMIIKARRAREQFLGTDLFADPAWDILLEAYLSEMRQTRVSVSALCIASAVPQTTGLRWLRKLEQDAWLCRREDPTDGRRSWMELTSEGSSRLTDYFDRISTELPI